jgi:hypothetical protein
LLHFDDVTQFLLANDYRDSGILWTKQVGTNIRLSVQWDHADRRQCTHERMLLIGSVPSADGYVFTVTLGNRPPTRADEMLPPAERALITYLESMARQSFRAEPCFVTVVNRPSLARLP